MLMKLGRETVLAAAFCVLAVPAWADANADANRLFVEAMQTWKQVEQIQGDSLEQAETRLELLQEIEANLSRIIDDHASSDLAVQLLLGPVGPLNLDGLPSLIERAEEQRKQSFVMDSVLQADKYLSSGDASRASKVLASAVGAARSISSARDSDAALSAIARRQAVGGESSRALNTLSFVRDATIRSRALRAVADAQVEAGDFVGAVGTAQQIADRDGRVRALRMIAEAQLNVGDFGGAVGTTQQIESFDVRALVLRAVSDAQSKAGDAAGARETLNFIPNLEENAYRWR